MKRFLCFWLDAIIPSSYSPKKYYFRSDRILNLETSMVLTTRNAMAELCPPPSLRLSGLLSLRTLLLSAPLLVGVGDVRSHIRFPDFAH